MPKLFLVLCICLACKMAVAQNDTKQHINPDQQNSKAQQEKPYVILVSADGFRYDYAEKFNAPNLLSYKASGVSATSMIPSYPSLTFPNHYSIVTGLYPAHHGLVANYYYDRRLRSEYGLSNRAVVEDGKRYGGTPLWVLAEQQQMITAGFYWPATEADVQGIHPTYWYRMNHGLSIERRIAVIRDWLLLPPEKRPHFIAVYFPQTDEAGHKFGPDAEQTGLAVRQIDSVMRQLVDAVQSTGLNLNFIFVSDHGMTLLDYKHPIPVPAAADSNKFIITSGTELLMLYARDKKYIVPAYKTLKAGPGDYDVFLAEDVPAYLHYNKKDDRYDRIGDIVLLPHWPRSFKPNSGSPKNGAHGFDPYKVKDMHAVFYAWGPAFKQQIHMPSFENVDVFPVIAKILGLEYVFPIDGTGKVAEMILK